MPMTHGRLTAAGAVIDVMLGVGPMRERLLRKHSLRVPGPVPVRAVIDTGASISGFASRFFKELELPPVGIQRILTPSTTTDTPCECELFDVTIYLIANGQPHAFTNLRVIAAHGWHPAAEEGVEALIGRDLLDQGTFYYYGKERTFTFGFDESSPTEW